MPLHDRDFSVLIRAALAGLSAVILVSAVPAPAFSAEEEETEASDAGSGILRNVLGSLGLRRSGERAIEYRERSPLVVPPKLDLPPPEPAGAAIKNPRWPNDPDVKRRREAAEARKKEVFDSANDDSRLLTREELNRGRVAGANARAGERGVKDVDETVLPASEMTKGSKKTGFWSIFSSEPETAPFTGEPPRTALTEPPKGYRTPASGQVYGVGHKVDAKPYDVMEKKGTEE
jgi:hypothetical protein